MVTARPRPLGERILDRAIRSLEDLARPPQQASTWLSWFRLRYAWLEPRPEDIYIATAPKAGTTWMQMILFQLATGGRGEFDHIAQVSPYLEKVAGMGGGGRRLLAALPSPRLLKTHVPYEKLRPPRLGRIVYMTRNAPDTVLSLYHHRCLSAGRRVDFDAFVAETVRGAGWFRHLESWWPHHADPSVLHVRYEDLVQDLEAGVRRIAAFCGLPIDETALGEILRRCGLPFMKQNNHRFDFRTPWHGPGFPSHGFIRTGGVGAGLARLSADQLAALERKVDGYRRRLGIPAEAV